MQPAPDPLAHLIHLASAAGDALTGLVPGAIGSFVAAVFERSPDLTWRQNLLQWVAGIAFASYLAPPVTAWLGWGGPAADSAKFVTGMIAFKAAPRLIDKASEVIGDLPADLRDRFLPRKEKP